jgi:hypothetical protein
MSWKCSRGIEVHTCPVRHIVPDVLQEEFECKLEERCCLTEKGVKWINAIRDGKFDCVHCASKKECKGDDPEEDVCGLWEEET